MIAADMTGTGSKRLPTKSELKREIEIKDSLHADLKLRMDILKYRYKHIHYD